MVALFGDRALQALGLPDEPGHAQTLADGVAFVDPRLARLGARAIVPRTAIDHIVARGFSAATWASPVRRGEWSPERCCSSSYRYRG